MPVAKRNNLTKKIIAEVIVKRIGFSESFIEKFIDNTFNEIKNSLTKNNIVGTPFVKETVVEDSINAKVLNDITEKNLKKENENSHKKNELDDQISDIFK